MSELAKTLKTHFTSVKNPVHEVKLKPLESETNFSSKIYLADISFSNSEDIKNLFAKTNPSFKNSKEINIFNNHFFNEAFFYNEAFPELIAELNCKNMIENLISQCHLANINSIIVDNEAIKGFKIGPKFLNIAHLRIAMKGLALYHASSLIFKFRQPDKFKELVSKIKETFSPNLKREEFPWRLTTIDALDRFIKSYPEKAYNYQETINHLKKLITDTAEFYKWLLRADEPLSVLCHGDFNRNNMHFLYNENGEPIAVKFFDFQTIRYASPTIDISFLYFMNVEPKIRAKNWETLISDYHGVLHSTICSELLLNPGDMKLLNFDLSQFVCEYAKRAIYGMTITLHFFRTVFALDGEFEPSMWQPEPSKEYWTAYLKMGGDYCNQLSDQMILHILEEGFALHLVDFPN